MSAGELNLAAPGSDEEAAPEIAALRPWDEHNRRLRSQVHPAGWVNPTPAPRYNLVVVGGGTAGLVTAAGAAGLGAKVALIERELLGGDCLNVGCVPSKALIRTARAVAEARRAGEFGVRIPGGVEVNFAAAMARMRRLRAGISPHDSAARFRSLGIDVFLGRASFSAHDTVMVDGATLRFARAAIATGARAAVPPISGLKDVPFLTNETVFSLTELPRRLAVLGAGPIGCELAQTFARFGSDVTLVDSGRGVLPREDRDAATRVRAGLERDGVRFLSGGRDLRLDREDGAIRLRSREGSGVAVDRLLVAVGRTPNVEDLGLEKAGVAYGADGVRVDDRLRTSNPRIYACGDVCSQHKFTHAADFMARIVIQNALFLGRAKASALTIPRATYTSPEVAQVGLTPDEARERGIEVDTFTQEMANVDRAVLDGEDHGFVRIHVRRGTDEIVGATIVAAHAGDLISEVAVAMKGRVGLRTLAATIHPYPTQAEAIRRIGDLYNRTRLTPAIRGIISRWLTWARRG
jgi:pyruvate/2-oxoglutarate dehydrogenase complex dihydrolipoamide dehydrogenase (E3) component